MTEELSPHTPSTPTLENLGGLHHTPAQLTTLIAQLPTGARKATALTLQYYTILSFTYGTW